MGQFEEWESAVTSVRSRESVVQSKDNSRAERNNRAAMLGDKDRPLAAMTAGELGDDTQEADKVTQNLASLTLHDEVKTAEMVRADSMVEKIHNAKEPISQREKQVEKLSDNEDELNQLTKRVENMKVEEQQMVQPGKRTRDDTVVQNLKGFKVVSDQPHPPVTQPYIQQQTVETAQVISSQAHHSYPIDNEVPVTLTVEDNKDEQLRRMLEKIHNAKEPVSQRENQVEKLSDNEDEFHQLTKKVENKKVEEQQMVERGPPGVQTGMADEYSRNYTYSQYPDQYGACTQPAYVNEQPTVEVTNGYFIPQVQPGKRARDDTVVQNLKGFKVASDQPYTPLTPPYIQQQTVETAQVISSQAHHSYPTDNVLGSEDYDPYILNLLNNQPSNDNQWQMQALSEQLLQSMPQHAQADDQYGGVPMPVASMAENITPSNSSGLIEELVMVPHNYNSTVPINHAGDCMLPPNGNAYWNTQTNHSPRQSIGSPMSNEDNMGSPMSIMGSDISIGSPVSTAVYAPVLSPSQSMQSVPSPMSTGVPSPGRPALPASPLPNCELEEKWNDIIGVISNDDANSKEPPVTEGDPQVNQSVNNPVLQAPHARQTVHPPITTNNAVLLPVQAEWNSKQQPPVTKGDPQVNQSVKVPPAGQNVPTCLPVTTKAVFLPVQTGQIILISTTQNSTSMKNSAAPLTADKLYRPTQYRHIVPKPPNPLQDESKVSSTTSTSSVKPRPMALKARRQHPPPACTDGYSSSKELQERIYAQRTVAALASGALTQSDQDGDTILHLAIVKKDIHIANEYLQRCQRENLLSAVVNKVNKTEQTAVFLAVVTNQPHIIRRLIECGADPNRRARYTGINGKEIVYRGPLHFAASRGQQWLESLKMLLSADPVEINAVDSEGLTPLHCAVRAHGNTGKDGQPIDCKETIKLLINNGARQDSFDCKAGKTAIHIAVEKNSIELVQLLCDLTLRSQQPALLNKQTFDGSTTLHLAVGQRKTNKADNIQLIKFLISHGADPSIKNHSRHTPKQVISVADQQHHQAIVDVLLVKK